MSPHHPQDWKPESPKTRGHREESNIMRRDPKVEWAPQQESTNADTTSSEKVTNPKRKAKVTKTFDGSTLCLNHHPYGSLQVNSRSDVVQGTRGGLRVVVRRMQGGSKKHLPPKRSWAEKTKSWRNLIIVFRTVIHPEMLSCSMRRNTVGS